MSAAAQSSTAPFFGRAYKITLTTSAGEQITISDSTWEPEALRVTFEIEQYALCVYWRADVTIYNLQQSTQNIVIRRGDILTVSAGYQANFNQESNLLFRGHIFQPIWERENVVDQKLTLRCLIGLFEDETNFVNEQLQAGATQEEAVFRVAYAAGIPIQFVDYKTLSRKSLPRGRVISGRPMTYFAEVAADNNLNAWLGFKGLNIRALAPQSDTPDVVYSPPYLPFAPIASTSGQSKQTLLGTPQQTQNGVTFSVLLDSQPDIGSLVKLDMTSVRLLPRFPGDNQLPSMLDRDGIYIVSGVAHRGDTRGNEWTTTIRGVTREWSRIYAGLAAHA
jgi:hypothetical protein